jgi:hypothetical protein
MFSRINAALSCRLGRTDPFAYLIDVHDAFSRYRRQYGRWPNLIAPQTFQEWIQRRKLFDRRREFAVFADKLAAREYIADRVGTQFLTKVYAVYTAPEQCELDALPEQFVLKLAAGWRKNLFVRDRHQLDEAQLRRTIRQWLRHNYYDVSREAAYRNVRQRVYAEELMLAEDGGYSWDYKINCFNGEPVAVQVFSDRYGERYAKGWYDPQWRPLPAGIPGQAAREYPRPATLTTMLAVAAALSAGFDYLRIDMYEHAGRAVVGEITFHPGNGFDPLVTADYQREFGRLWCEARQRLREQRPVY